MLGSKQPVRCAPCRVEARSRGNDSLSCAAGTARAEHQSIRRLCPADKALGPHFVFRLQPRSYRLTIQTLTIGSPSSWHQRHKEVAGDRDSDRQERDGEADRRQPREPSSSQGHPKPDPAKDDADPRHQVAFTGRHKDPAR